MKTIEKWFLSVRDETLRQQLLRNLVASNTERVVSSLGKAINSFSWNQSVEGQDYWSEMYENYKDIITEDIGEEEEKIKDFEIPALASGFYSWKPGPENRITYNPE